MPTRGPTAISALALPTLKLERRLVEGQAVVLPRDPERLAESAGARAEEAIARRARAARA